MLKLTNAVVPFDGDEVLIPSGDEISSISVDHSLINSDCTKIEMKSGTIFLVKESVDDIEAMLAEK